MLAQDIRAESFKAKVRKNRNCRSLFFVPTNWCIADMDLIRLQLSWKTIKSFWTPERCGSVLEIITCRRGGWMREKEEPIFNPLKVSVHQTEDSLKTWGMFYLWCHVTRCKLIFRIDFCVCFPSYLPSHSQRLLQGLTSLLPQQQEVLGSPYLISVTKK